ncbi:MAG: phosphoglucosamine mutase [Candidatus Bipolaricaulia bacterium]
MFGTDGVRGIANRELTPELAMGLGRAASLLAAGEFDARAVVGRDTRRSGAMLEAAFAAGLASVGIDVLLVGVVPTPTIPFLIREFDARFGTMISASHNPAEDNGIKFFGPDGFKIPESLEAHLETALIEKAKGEKRPMGTGIGRIRVVEDGLRGYRAYLADEVMENSDLDGVSILIDCANGATSEVASRVLRGLGAELIPIHNAPDGDNINRACGSTDMRMLQNAVRLYDVDLGAAYDGDGDRVLMVDADGEIVDGDQLMVCAALHLEGRGRLDPRTVVATVMSNMGMERALNRHKIELIRTRVGDRYVAQEMEACGARLGGEQCGHIIFRDHSTTGDGLITTLKILEVMKAETASLKELVAQMERYPQALRNVPAQYKERFSASEPIEEALTVQRRRFGEAVRILVRPSGTQPVIRVMVEGEDEPLIAEIADKLATVIEKELN